MSGSCVFCGRVVDVKPIKFPSTFTAYQFLQSGSGVCGECYKMFKDDNVRRKNWVWTKDGLRFVDSPLDVLLDPPDPPFRIYITKSRRKHGWVRLVNLVNYSKNRFWVGFDEEVLLVDRVELTKLVELARFLRGVGATKEEMLTANFKIKTLEGVGVDVFEKVRMLKGNPIWEVVVYLVK